MRLAIAVPALLLLAAGLAGCGSGGTPTGTAGVSGAVTLLGSPTGGVEVIAYRDSGTPGSPREEARATSDSSGSYALGSLPAGSYSLYARSGEYAGVFVGAVLAEGGQVSAPLELLPSGTLTGQVTQDGVPAAGARVWVAGVPVTATTEADGSYTLRGVPTGGPYTVLAAGTAGAVAVETNVAVSAEPSEPQVLALSTTGNHLPQIASVTAGPISVAPGGTSIVRCLAADTDGGTLTYAWSAPSGGSVSPASGTQTTWTAPATAGNYLVVVTVTDSAGGAVAGAVSIQVASPGNQQPQIATVDATPFEVTVGSATTVTCLARDTDGDALTYTWAGGAGGVYTATAYPHIVSWRAPLTAGSYRLLITVADGRGGATVGVVTVLVTQPNRAPGLSTMTPGNGVDYAPGQSVACAVTASDPDSDPLVYGWTATGGSFAGTGASVTWTAPQQSGTYTITCTVTDGKGGVASASRTVTVSDTNVIIW